MPSAQDVTLYVEANIGSATTLTPSVTIYIESAIRDTAVVNPTPQMANIDVTTYTQVASADPPWIVAFDPNTVLAAVLWMPDPVANYGHWGFPIGG